MESLNKGKESLNKDGSLYKPGTLGCIRAGIQRHLQAPPLNRPINLCLDPAFMTANKVLNAKAKLYLKNPQATKTAHKRDICDADLLLIGNFLKSHVFECPSYLQLGVWFLSAYFWGKRGCEQWRLISKSDIEFDADERGEFVTLCNRRALIAKNYKGGLKKSDVDNADSPKLCDLKDVSVSPYNIIKTYVEKLPASGPLFSTADDKRFKLKDHEVVFRKTMREKHHQQLYEAFVKCLLSFQVVHQPVRWTKYRHNSTGRGWVQ